MPLYNSALSVKQLRNPNEIDGQMYGDLFVHFYAIETYISFETTIRIRFTDRTQLEKIFTSTDKIRSVYAFVRSSLRDDVKPIKFILCKAVLYVHVNSSRSFRLRPTAKPRPQSV